MHKFLLVATTLAALLIGAPTAASATAHGPVYGPVRHAESTACDKGSMVRAALAALGEHVVHVRIVTPARMAAEIGDSRMYGYAVAESLTFNSAMQCRYVASTAAHEVAHIWQGRSLPSRDAYQVLGRDATEIQADCAAVLTGWDDYRPYLTQRQQRTGQIGCTDSELASARALRIWAR